MDKIATLEYQKKYKYIPQGLDSEHHTWHILRK